MQIAEGLAYSHHRLVLHLDVKPGNVRVLDRRQAKILDFGIARLATSGAPGPGAMVGTAGYLPPEQVMSKTVDARSDVFAFGALAYELLTFSRPFAGGTIRELLERVLAAEAEPMTRATGPTATRRSPTWSAAACVEIPPGATRASRCCSPS